MSSTATPDDRRSRAVSLLGDAALTLVAVVWLLFWLNVARIHLLRGAAVNTAMAGLVAAVALYPIAEQLAGRFPVEVDPLRYSPGSWFASE
ncbi:MAG: hypothetical protein ABEJ23_07770 [Haloarculaceae archaeon]